MCNYCDKPANYIPQESGCKMSMICKHCGTRVGHYTYSDVREMMNEYESTISALKFKLKMAGIDLRRLRGQRR